MTTDDDSGKVSRVGSIESKTQTLLEEVKNSLDKESNDDLDIQVAS